MAAKRKDPQNPSIKFYDEEHLARILGVERRIFHREIKPLMVADFSDELAKLGISNPDVGLDALNNLYLADTDHAVVFKTGLTLFDYICDNE